MNRKTAGAAKVPDEDVLVDIARSIGSALGTVAAKITPVRKAVRRSVRAAQKTETKIVKATASRMKKRSSPPKSKSKARRAKAAK